MRVAVFEFSDKVWRDHFKPGVPMWGNQNERITVTDGVPEGARLLDVKFRPEIPTILFLYEHESFPELPEASYMWDAERRYVGMRVDICTCEHGDDCHFKTLEPPRDDDVSGWDKHGMNA